MGRRAWFGTNYASNPNTLDAADYDHDGLSDTLEFLLGSDPTTRTALLLPTKVRVKGEAYYQWKIPVNPVAAPAIPLIQNSDDLRNWMVPTTTADGNVIIEQGTDYRIVQLRASAFPASFLLVGGQLGQ